MKLRDKTVILGDHEGFHFVWTNITEDAALFELGFIAALEAFHLENPVSTKKWDNRFGGWIRSGMAVSRVVRRDIITGPVCIGCYSELQDAPVEHSSREPYDYDIVQRVNMTPNWFGSNSDGSILLDVDAAVLNCAAQTITTQESSDDDDDDE